MGMFGRPPSRAGYAGPLYNGYMTEQEFDAQTQRRPQARVALAQMAGPTLGADAMSGRDASGLRAVDPVAAPKVQRGMFGALRRSFNDPRGRFGIAPESWQQIAAGLHDLSTGENTLPSLQQQQFENQRQRAEDAWRARQRERETTQWGREDDQRAQVEAYISSLPPEQQGQARLDPGAFIKSQLAGDAGAIRAIEGDSEIVYYDTRTGEEVGRSKLRPRAQGGGGGGAPMSSSLPPGWSEY